MCLVVIAVYWLTPGLSSDETKQWHVGGQSMCQALAPLRTGYHISALATGACSGSIMMSSSIIYAHCRFSGCIY